ncbi:Hypothetical protein R9X50_00119500 [Acrodontium crateriforme]|uniref:BAG domain-containing protein n=1 Tax=Acrodontium crateriforme TaxID=150365 RepID=A0AAQ3M217_9PEZI|nr:Hypothetical protein R9X50_00119500 [Acrodontium crateriforme]
MSWTSRLGNLGRFSPFTRSPPQGSSKVSDSDFSYITADDLRKHQAEANKHSQHTVESPQEYGPPRDTDVLVLRNKKKDFTVHFPAYSIPRGELTIGQVREQAGKKTGTADWRRVKLLYKGKNLKDDSRTCKQEGVREGAELMCTIADSIPSDSPSDDSEDDEFGGQDNDNGDGAARKKRNRGKRSKRKNKREQNSGTSTPLESSERLGVPPATQRAPSPKPPATPATPIEKLDALFATLHSFIPDCDKFKSAPPGEPAKRDFEHKRLSETLLTQVLLKADGVEVEGDTEARMRRKELVKETQAILQSLDAAVKA